MKSRPRSFNQLIFDHSSVTKISQDVSKGQDEIFFYKNLPFALKKYFPKVFESHIHKTSARYTMEFIPGPDLSHLYLHRRLNTDVFLNLLKHLDEFWSKTPKRKVPVLTYQNHLRKLTTEKLHHRWRQYEHTSIALQAFRHFAHHQMIDIPTVKDWIIAELEDEIKKSTETSLVLSPGDLCFSNIFLQSERILFVDPRGGRTQNDLLIPLIYDLAKLSQCIYGNYDGILHQKIISFERQQKMFSNWLKMKKVHRRLLRLIEASHFLSLVPLHMDTPQLHVPFFQAAIDAAEEVA